MSITPDVTENPWAELGKQPTQQPQQSKSPRSATNPTFSSTTPKRTVAKKLSYINVPTKDLIFGICIVNFHHLRGPEIEYSKLSNLDIDPVSTWPLLPFQALPDGAHSFEETFSCFTLNYKDETTLFAISCARQIRSDELVEKDKDITRSSVQKSVVVILRQPIYGQIREKLSIVTKAFFEQKNFNDILIVNTLYDSLVSVYNNGKDVEYVDENDFYLGLSLKALLKNFKKDVLVILKAMLLEKKVAFYGSNPTELCQTEFSFISLVPNLINNLLDCSSPNLNNYAINLTPSTSFKTSDRNSVLKFAGLPLQIFGIDGVFSPYSPLQQFDDLKKINHYVIGTSNALLLNQKAQLADVLINIDTHQVDILNPDLIQPLTLSSYDKKWLSQLVTSSVKDTNETEFLGNDDYIRWQFEDYLLGLLSTVKFDNFLKNHDNSSFFYKDQYDLNQIKNFNTHFVNSWKQTNNYILFNELTDDHLFDVFEPKHIHMDDLNNKSLSEKFQQFKLDNTRKFEEYKKGFLSNKENVVKSQDTNNGNVTNHNNNDFKKNTAKIWPWYKKKDKENKE